MKIALLLLVAIAAIVTADDSASGLKPGGFKIVTQKPEDAVEIGTGTDLVTLSVKSPSGIGRATVERRDKAWPTQIVLRLHLTGLEFFQLSNGQTTLHAAISVQDRKARLWKDGQENTPLDEKNPLWMPIRPMSADGKPTQAYPLKNGYFEMFLPKALLEKNPPSLAIDWIDFFRN